MHIEQHLIKDLACDNELAFEKLFNIYQRKIYHFAFGYLKNKDKAECTVQTVFMKLWEIRHQLNDEHSLNNLLYKITKNNVLNQIRHSNYQNEYCKYFLDKKHFRATDNSTDDNINLKDVEDFIQREIDKMPQKRKLIFLMSRSEFQSSDDIAKKLNISKRTVDNQIYRAIKQLKHSMSLENI